MKLDESGRELIKSFEALSLKVYKDRVGVWTIGWGHTYGVNEKTAPIDECQAEMYFHADCDPCEQLVTKTVKVDLTQNEFNALVSLTFNIGLPRFQTSTLLRTLNAGDRQGAAKQFDKWIYATDRETGEIEIVEALVNRRRLEKALFLTEFLEARTSHAG